MQVCDDRQAVCAHFHSQLVYGTARPIGNKKAAANATATLILALLAYPLKDTKKGEGARFPAFCAFPPFNFSVYNLSPSGSTIVTSSVQPRAVTSPRGSRELSFLPILCGLVVTFIRFIRFVTIFNLLCGDRHTDYRKIVVCKHL